MDASTQLVSRKRQEQVLGQLSDLIAAVFSFVDCISILGVLPLVSCRVPHRWIHSEGFTTDMMFANQ